MTPLVSISIHFSENEIGFIRACFREVLSGASTREMGKMLGDDLPLADPILKKIDAQRSTLDAASLTLTKTEFQIVYDAVHAAIYGLGEFELTTLTGFPLNMAVNTNLKIAHRLWGVYGESKY